jgi:hypothetical protein
MAILSGSFSTLNSISSWIKAVASHLPRQGQSCDAAVVLGLVE